MFCRTHQAIRSLTVRRKSAESGWNVAVPDLSCLWEPAYNLSYHIRAFPWIFLKSLCPVCNTHFPAVGMNEFQDFPASCAVLISFEINVIVILQKGIFIKMIHWESVSIRHCGGYFYPRTCHSIPDDVQFPQVHSRSGCHLWSVRSHQYISFRFQRIRRFLIRSLPSICKAGRSRTSRSGPEGS